MKSAKESTGADFRQLEEFVAARRRVYEKSYKQIRNQRYALGQRGVHLGSVYALTNATEFSKLLIDLKKPHDKVWRWYHNGHCWRIRAAAAVTEDVSEELIEN